jgi:hypothetical protein
MVEDMLHFINSVLNDEIGDIEKLKAGNMYSLKSPMIIDAHVFMSFVYNTSKLEDIFYFIKKGALLTVIRDKREKKIVRWDFLVSDKDALFTPPYIG